MTDKSEVELTYGDMVVPKGKLNKKLIEFKNWKSLNGESWEETIRKAKEKNSVNSRMTLSKGLKKKKK